MGQVVKYSKIFQHAILPKISPNFKEYSAFSNLKFRNNPTVNCLPHNKITVLFKHKTTWNKFTIKYLQQTVRDSAISFNLFFIFISRKRNCNWWAFPFNFFSKHNITKHSHIYYLWFSNISFFFHLYKKSILIEIVDLNEIKIIFCGQTSKKIACEQNDEYFSGFEPWELNRKLHILIN